ncbi:hypothetical protein GSI_14963 [Ganoderma sinense ZZ0214-1]|uniref:Uncharacterized protein n=1 Tax=Ganoderma sinense ZZ0214-1 TaxID=1077348 RepID=A0A2G8RQ59_9APHY|nr:hypothetical protein GSI_14963 [Ganoderma sinense ZZ0214-1]
MQRVVRWYPPAYDIRVEDVPIPSVVDPDDAIVKVHLAGLCGSDLHIYRGHEDVDRDIICGHEIIGEVIALGTSFNPSAAARAGRPELYSTLKIGDKVVSPFTVSCGECHFCRIGFTCRCVHSRLFGSPALSGGQAQYVRIPKAGGTLFNLTSIHAPPSNGPQDSLSKVSDSSILLLADILPTGAFAAIQAIQHPKIATILTGKAYPFGAVVPGFVTDDQTLAQLQPKDRTLTIAVVGLGPVGVCAVVSLLHILAELEDSKGVELAYQVIAVDPLETRRVKMEAVYKAIHTVGTGPQRFLVTSIDEAKKASSDWTDGAGCNAVLEVVGNNSALTLAYDIVRPFGVITSVGVHQEPPLPFNGRSVYDKNVSFDFGRCPVRAMFPLALEILLKRQDVFGGVGEEASLIDRVVSLNDAPDIYEQFDKGKCGKVLFNPWL